MAPVCEGSSPFGHPMSINKEDVSEFWYWVALFGIVVVIIIGFTSGVISSNTLENELDIKKVEACETIEEPDLKTDCILKIGA